MESSTYSIFKMEPYNLLEGYITRFANLESKEEKEGFQIIDNYNDINQNNLDLVANINAYKEKNEKVDDYDLIDDSGNLIYKKDFNFIETIPTLKDAVLEDSLNVLNYNTNIYAISGIAVAFLIIGMIVSYK